ncbi:MAG: phosphoglucosamine mutase [Pseudomonadota bacterium]
MARYFGTDGIRGRAGEGKLALDALEHMAQAIGAYFGTGKTAVVARDTRESGPDIQTALTQGLTGQGISVTHLGVLPTPACAFGVSHLNADFGLIITASHNPWHDNGVKLFGPDGRKISDQAQSDIEDLIEQAMGEGLPKASQFGSVSDNESIADAYGVSLIEAFQSTGQASLSGLKVAVDCANGAAFKVLPDVLERLDAVSTLIGVSPDGRNINADCGSTYPEALVAAVKVHNADIGVALDGDADRLILVDHHGAVVDGDQIIARLATDWKAQGRLKSGRVVSTVMSNLGLDHHLSGLDLALERTPVGDRHVAARMGETGSNLGGEPSGHLLMTDYGPTGDGSLAALMVLSGLLASGQKSGDYLSVFDPFPQLLKNVRYEGVSPLGIKSVQEAISAANERLGDDGRVLVRASGTEPVIRVMAEARDSQIVSDTVVELCALIESAAS